MVKVIAIISSSAATRPIWQITQRQCLSRFRSARKLSITQEQSGQRITQFISNTPSAAACGKRSIVSAAARHLSAANLRAFNAQKLRGAR
jgi:hypothetical protein